MFRRRDDRGARNTSAGRRQTVHAQFGGALLDRRFQVASQVLAGNGRERFRGVGAQGAAELRRRRRTVPVGAVRQRRGRSVEERQYNGRRASETGRVQDVAVHQRSISQPVQGAFPVFGSKNHICRAAF